MDLRESILMALMEVQVRSSHAAVHGLDSPTTKHGPDTIINPSHRYQSEKEDLLVDIEVHCHSHVRLK